MLKIYGSMLCADCATCLKDLDQAGIAYEFIDFCERLQYLKDFLKLRDTCPTFYSVKESGTIGIPCILDDDGNVTLDWNNYVSQAKT